MPIPKPNDGESREDFMSRCMSNDKMQTEFGDVKQRAAVCSTSFKTNDRSTKQPVTNSFKVNLDGNMTWKVLDGKKYLVGPVVMITEGVHNNVYYPAEELAKFPQAWNGRHVPVYHPEDLVGNNISANDPETIEKHSVGFIFNTHFKDGKLKAELWVDPEKANAVDEDVMSMLLNNMMIEVSTGLFVEEIKAPGEWKGEKYTTIAVNYRPDHLALLPKEIGACSIADGAGFPRVNSEEHNALRKKFEELSKLLANADLSFDTIREAVWSKLKLDHAAAYIYVNDIFDKYVIYEVQPKEMSENDLIKLYRRSYIIEETGTVTLGEAVEVKRVTKYEEVDGDEGKQITKSLSDMKSSLTQNNKGDRPMKEKVNALIANNQTHWTEQDRSYLEGLDEGILDKMLPIEKPAEPVTNSDSSEKKTEQPAAPAQPAQVSLEAIDALIEQKLNANQAKPIIDRLAANEKCPFDAQELAKFSVEKLRKLEDSLAANAQPKQRVYIGQGGSPAPKTNAVDENAAPAMPVLFANSEEKNK